MAGSLHLGLHGRVAVQFGLSHQRKERQHQLVLGRNRGMREDHGLFRVDAGGQYMSQWETGRAAWITLIVRLNEPTLPKTGY